MERLKYRCQKGKQINNRIRKVKQHYGISNITKIFNNNDIIKFNLVPYFER